MERTNTVRSPYANAEDAALALIWDQLRPDMQRAHKTWVVGDAPTWAELSDLVNQSRLDGRRLEKCRKTCEAFQVSADRQSRLMTVLLALYGKATNKSEPLAKGDPPLLQEEPEKGVQLINGNLYCQVVFPVDGRFLPVPMSPVDAERIMDVTPKNPFVGLLIGVHEARNRPEIEVKPLSMMNNRQLPHTSFSPRPGESCTSSATKTLNLPTIKPGVISPYPALPEAYFRLGHIEQRLVITGLAMASRNLFGFPDQCLLPETTVKDLLAWMYGKDARRDRNWRGGAGRQGGRLVEALNVLNSRAGALYVREDGGAVWPVKPGNVMPTTGALHEPIQLSVWLPENTNKGVKIDWAALLWANKDSLMRTIMLSLQAGWHQPGRLQTGQSKRRRGRLCTSNNPDTYDKYFPIRGDKQVWLGYPTQGPSRGKTGTTRWRRVRECLAKLAGKEWLQFTPSEESIMPGKRWGGHYSDGITAARRRLERP